MKSIKDLIYFDYEKAKSLNSQLSGGLISELTRAIEKEGGLDAETGIDIKLFKAKVGGSEREKSVSTEKIELYHELLNQIERQLTEKDILKNLNTTFETSGGSFNDFLLKLPNFTYVKTSGWSSFEDYERFKRIMANFNDIQRLIFSSAIENNPGIITIKKQINDLKRGLKKVPNPKEAIRLKAIEKNFDEELEKASDASFLDETFIERIKIFLDTFTPNRLNFRLLPFDMFSEFQILANLKSEYLVNGDFENLIYTYGSRPNIKLTAFGIISSCPQIEDNRVNHSDEFLSYDDDELTEDMVYNKAFRSVFNSFENFEKFFFVPRYPKIAISPIAIYREVSLE